MPTLREWVIEWSVMVAIGVALAALGPFGSFALGSFGARLAYWLPAAFVGYAIVRPIALAADGLARRLRLPMLAATLAATLFAAIPGTFAIALLGGYRLDRAPAFDTIFQLYVQVAVIAVIVATLFTLLGRLRAAETPTVERALATVQDAPAMTAPAPPFFQRLPRAWADRLVALEMEDHYVRAHGPGASALILMRMRDAEAELSGLAGLRVHRSWWVRRDAVEGVARDGRNLRLRLGHGLEAPVARERVAEMRALGWLD